jgi:hypothetical protein
MGWFLMGNAAKLQFSSTYAALLEGIVGSDVLAMTAVNDEGAMESSLGFPASGAALSTSAGQEICFEADPFVAPFRADIPALRISTGNHLAGARAVQTSSGRPVSGRVSLVAIAWHREEFAGKAIAGWRPDWLVYPATIVMQIGEGLVAISAADDYTRICLSTRWRSFGRSLRPGSRP